MKDTIKQLEQDVKRLTAEKLVLEKAVMNHYRGNQRKFLEPIVQSRALKIKRKRLNEAMTKLEEYLEYVMLNGATRWS